MNRLFQCTLGAIIVAQIVPFLPLPHPDIRFQSADSLMTPRLYSAAQRDSFVASVRWVDQFGCPIWHHFEGPRILWFANDPVRSFLSILLSPCEDLPYTLGIRSARRVDSDQVASWGPASELDNPSVLVLLAKSFASVSRFY